MSDEQYLRDKYPDFLGDGASTERVRIIGDIKAMSSAYQPPAGLDASITRTLREGPAVQASHRKHVPGLRQHGRDEHEKVTRPGGRSLLWLRALRRGMGVAGLAGFVVVVGIIAVGLAVTFSRMQREPSPQDFTHVAATALAGIPAGAPVSTPLPEAAVSPLLKGGGVLHIKRTTTGRTDRGEEVFKVEDELWYDRATGDARYENRNVLDLSNSSILVHKGQTDTLYFPAKGALSTTEVPRGSVSGAVESMFERKVYLDRGVLVQAVGVAPPESQIAVRRPGETADTTPATTYLDRATGLTREIRNVRWGGRDGSLLYEYPVIETLDRASLLPDLFSIQAPASVPPAVTEGPASPVTAP